MLTFLHHPHHQQPQATTVPKVDFRCFVSLLWLLAARKIPTLRQ